MTLKSRQTTKSALSPLNLAIDSVAMLVGMFLWFCFLLVPAIFILVVVQAIKNGTSIAGPLFVAALVGVPMLIVAYVIKRIFSSVILRRRGAITLAILFLLGVTIISSVRPLVKHSYYDTTPVQLYMQAILLTTMSAILLLGFSKAARVR